MKQATRFTKLALLLIVAGSLVLAGCGGDDGVSPADHQAALDEAAAERAAAEKKAAEEKEAAEAAAAAERARLGRIADARTAIAAAATAEDADAAYDAVKDEATDAESAELMKAVADRKMAIATAEENQRLEMERQAEMARQGRIADALTAIAAADSAEAAQAAYDMVKDEATTTEAAALMQAVMDRTAALAMMDRAAQQMMALTAAAANVDVTAFDLTTPTGIAAAEAALEALKMALAAAADVSDTDKAMYQLRLDAASAPVMAARAESDRMGRIEAARQAIAVADTPAAAQAAYDAVKDDATATEGAGLQAAVDMRTAELATMDRAAAQMMALSTAAGNIDLSDLSTQDAVNAASMAIAALEAALAAAADVSDANKATYQATVDASKTAVMTAQGALDHAAQTMVLANAVTGLQAIDLGNLSTQAAIDAAQAAIDTLKMALEAATELSAAEKSAALVELATASRTVMMAQGRVDVADQMAALSTAHTALAAIDLNDLMTQAQIDAAKAAIVALDLALADAMDLTAAQKLDATVAVTLAKRSVMAAQTTLDGNIETQRTALTKAGTALAAIDLDDLDTAEKIAAAKAAVADLMTALAEATHLSDAEKEMYQTQHMAAYETVKMAETGMGLTGRMAAQSKAITDAQAEVSRTVAAVNDSATDAQVMAADDAIAKLKQAIEDADDLGEDHAVVVAAKAVLTTLEAQLTGAKMSRTAKMEADAERQDRDMEVMALRRWRGIDGDPLDDTVGTATDEGRVGRYNTAHTAIEVVAPATGQGTDAVTLMEDKKTSVAELHDWKGKRYYHKVEDTVTTRPHQGDTYEAIVYSDVGEPTMGKKFGSATALPTAPAELAAFAYQYQLTDGALSITTGAITSTDANELATQRRVASPRFDQNVGTKTFSLPSPNDAGATKITIPGTYHGVSGNYICDLMGTTGTCSATVAAEGFVLATTSTETGAGWSFRPTNAEARVSDAPDTNYASYGWWLYTDASSETFLASAFVDINGALTDASGITDLKGEATYTGGAAGQYAIHSASSTGGENDAGAFTARVMLEADFDDDTIEGTINSFMGADGQPRDWSVELMESAVGDTGIIRKEVLDTDGVTRVEVAATQDPAMTKWTIKGMAADTAAGEWSGTLRDPITAPDPKSGTPKVVTGTFYSEYNNTGRMVGAFGANVQP